MKSMKEPFNGDQILQVSPEGLTLLAKEARQDVSFTLGREFLDKLLSILDDPEASYNDSLVALALLENAAVASKGVLPLCQDTGTATVYGCKGDRVWTGGNDKEHLSQGIFDTYTQKNLRYSQNIAQSMYEEANSNCNLPAQIDIQSSCGMEYRFLFMAKGGGSSNKTALFQEPPALLDPDTLKNYLVKKI